MLMNTIPTPESILQQIAQIPRIERGQISVIRQGPNGPYYNHQTWENGKNVSRYVPEDQVAALQEAIAGYERLQALLDQYVQLREAQSRAQRTAGAKKKSRRPRSSWPKTRRSNS
jgi:Family of unknown function (DUF6788)